MKAIQIDDEVMARIVQELESGPRSVVLHYSYDVRVAGHNHNESIGTWRIVETEPAEPAETEDYATHLHRVQQLLEESEAQRRELQQRLEQTTESENKLRRLEVAARQQAAQLAEALRLTQEYTQIPPVEGWSWFDALNTYLDWAITNDPPQHSYLSPWLADVSIRYADKRAEERRKYEGGGQVNTPVDAAVHRTDETPVARRTDGVPHRDYLEFVETTGGERRICGAQPDDEQWAEMGDGHKPVCQLEPGHDRVMRPGGLGKPVYWDHIALTSGGSTFMWNTRRTIGVGNEILVTPLSPSGKTHELELERDGRHPDEAYADPEQWLDRHRARKADPPTREQASIEDTIGWAFGWDIEKAQMGDGGPEAELTRWWLELAAKESTRVVPKAIEYGAGDLVEIGRQLVQAGQFKLDPERTEASQLASLGVYFYLIGKVARWTSAIESGRGVSDDTLHDIGVYVRMAQRIREVGAWPGVQL